MSDYKPFREKMIECKNDGNQIDVDVAILKLKIFPPLFKGQKDLMDMEKIIVCLKYKSACCSSLCKKERGVN